MDLIRQLLLDLENDKYDAPSGYVEEEIAYHKALIVESKLAHGHATVVMNGSILAEITRLTWEGHEFLDAARNETGWRATMKRIATTVGTTSLPVLQALLVEYAKSTLQGTPQP